MPRAERAISVSMTQRAAVPELSHEIVERKGIGHPDTICDSALEAVSLALGDAYKRLFNRPLHYNIDKGLLIAGEVEKGFGKGRVIKPMELIIGDRATFESGGVKVPVDAIAKEAARRWFEKNLKNLDSRKDVIFTPALAPGSAELSGIFKPAGEKKPALANDTSAAFGFAPLSPLEKAVFGAERFLNSPEFKERFPETGEDVKVMGVRLRGALELTLAMPMLSKRVESERAYFKKKKEILKCFEEFTGALKFRSTSVHFNSLDRPGLGVDGVYLSLTGTSAEDADSGQVGRGNSVNGLASLMRPSSAEAAAGKNPVSHVGKIYSVLAHRIAFDIHASSEGRAREVYVWLLSKIGTPIDRPWRAVVEIVPEKGASKAALVKKANAAVERSLCDIGRFTDGLTGGLYPVC